MSSTAANRQETEKDISILVKDTLERFLGAHYVVHTDKSILYKIEVDAFGKVNPASIDSPTRGQYAFQTDVLIERRGEPIPLVVIELKYGSFTSHDVITYSAKAARHKEIYPYLRYGFVVVGLETLSRKFLTHNAGFDFAMAVSDLKTNEAALAALIQKQVVSAECLMKLLRSSRIKFTKYEETVHID